MSAKATVAPPRCTLSWPSAKIRMYFVPRGEGMVRLGRSSFPVTSHMAKLARAMQSPCWKMFLLIAVAQHHHQTFAQHNGHLGRACPSNPATPSPDVHHSL
ncbi:hypothetical protein IWX48DRAFT_659868, partial [Phyllosticta citricarpa]